MRIAGNRQMTQHINIGLRHTPFRILPSAASLIYKTLGAIQ